MSSHAHDRPLRTAFRAPSGSDELAAGTTLGSYRIDRVLGRGGMGTVYAAYDATLRRRVALKVLAGASDDESARARLLHEARNAAALVHPAICTIYEVAEASSVAFIAMEYVDGVSLRDRLDCGALPLADALACGIEAAGALAYAHARGVVHRDLKAANAIVTADGHLKIVDFGLARRTDPLMTQATTMSSFVPAGVLAGTPYAMAPEQVRGNPADPRTDVWALGVLLYEMTSGAQPFAGGSPPAIFSAIAADPPQPLPDSVPPALRSVIARCLEKDPARRYQTAADVRRDLEAIARRRNESTGSRGRRLLVRLLSAAAIAAAVLIGVAGWRIWSSRAPSAEPLHLSVVQATSAPGIEWFPSLSPDGRWMVYASDAAGNMDIYLQSVSGQNTMNLTRASAADDDQPVFSPDGEQIAFRSSRDGGGIFVMGRTGESVRRITHGGYNPSWSPDGRTLVYATEGIDINPQNSTGRSTLNIVNVAGGDATPLEVPGRDAVQPRWSPHGTRIAYMVRFGIPPRSAIRTIPAGGGESVAVTESRSVDWNPVWSPDGRYVYFASDRGGSMNLWRVAIDETTGRTLSNLEPLTVPGAFVGHIAIANDGRHLAFASMARSANVEKLSLDPSNGRAVGEPSSVTIGTRTWSNPDPSPDGQSVAFYSGLNPVGHLYVQRVDGSDLRQLTTDDAADRMPHWSSDGKWLLFFSNRSRSGYELWKIRPDGSDLQQVTYARQATYSDWSPDGRRIAATMLATGEGQQTRLAVFDASQPWHEQASDMLPRMTANDFYVTGWTPDGRRLVGQVGPGAGGVATYSFDTSSYDRLTTYGEWPTALPDGRHLLFVSGGKAFFVVDAATHAVTKVFSTERDVIGPPRLTRDGRAAFFTRRVTQSDIWLATLDAR